MNAPTTWGKVIEYGSSLTCNDGQDIYNHLVNELLRGLSRYNLIDEMVVYILPVIAGMGTLVFDDLTPSRWNMYKSTSFSNGITRIIYRNSCILQ